MVYLNTPINYGANQVYPYFPQAQMQGVNNDFTTLLLASMFSQNQTGTSIPSNDTSELNDLKDERIEERIELNEEIGEIELSIKMKSDLRLEIAQDAVAAAGDQAKLNELHAKDVQLEKEIADLEKKYQTTRKALNKIESKEDPYGELAEDAPLASTPENKALLKKYKKELKAIKEEREEIAEKAILTTDAAELAKLHTKSQKLYEKQIKAEEKLALFEARLDAGENQTDNTNNNNLISQLMQLFLQGFSG